MLSSIKKSEFSRDLLKMFSGTVLSQIIVVIGSLILARMYSPKEFGELSLFISIVSILAILATARYENVIILVKQNYLINNIMNFLHFTSLFFAIFIILILLTLSNDILVYLKIHTFSFYIPVGVLIYALFQISTNLNVRERNFSTIAKSKVLMAFTTLTLQILFFYLGISLGLIYGYIIGYIAAVFLLYQHTLIPLSINIHKIKTCIILKKYFYLVKHGLPADFINNLATNITPVLIATWFDLQIAGLYFLGYRMINLPLQLISLSISKVYFKKASDMYYHDKKKLYIFTKKIVLGIFSLILVPLMILYFYSENIIEFILGNKWSEAGVYISILTVMFLSRTMFSPISSIAEVTKKLYIVLYFSVYSLISTVMSLYIGQLSNDFYLAVLLLSFSISAGYFFLLVYFLVYLKKVSKKEVY